MGKNAKLKQQRKAAQLQQKSVTAHLPRPQDRHLLSGHRSFNRLTNPPNIAKAPNHNDFKSPTIPSPELIQYWFSHPDTLNWVLSQWNLLFGFETSVSHDHASSLAASMLQTLHAQTLLDLDHDLRVKYTNSPYFEMNIGLNVCHWTLWTSIHHKLTNLAVLSQDSDDFDLKRLQMN